MDSKAEKQVDRQTERETHTLNLNRNIGRGETKTGQQLLPFFSVIPDMF